MMTPPLLNINVIAMVLNNQLQYSWYFIKYLLYFFIR
jgi:hypothetical protein